ncbi:MAG TPA: hypothetical protein DDW42_10125 [Desulfobacteraceae bacterium]|nr:hypothetical protein [Desulfobacteraceae bacterium]
MEEWEKMMEKNEKRSLLMGHQRETYLPKIHQEFELNGQRWVVSYLNHGQMRFTALWLGKVKAKGNVTLDVHSTKTKTQSKIK